MVKVPVHVSTAEKKAANDAFLANGKACYICDIH